MQKREEGREVRAFFRVEELPFSGARGMSGFEHPRLKLPVDATDHSLSKPEGIRFSSTLLPYVTGKGILGREIADDDHWSCTRKRKD